MKKQLFQEDSIKTEKYTFEGNDFSIPCKIIFHSERHIPICEALGINIHEDFKGIVCVPNKIKYNLNGKEVPLFINFKRDFYESKSFNYLRNVIFVGNFDFQRNNYTSNDSPNTILGFGDMQLNKKYYKILNQYWKILKGIYYKEEKYYVPNKYSLKETINSYQNYIMDIARALCFVMEEMLNVSKKYKVKKQDMFEDLYNIAHCFDNFITENEKENRLNNLFSPDDALISSSNKEANNFLRAYIYYKMKEIDENTYGKMKFDLENWTKFFYYAKEEVEKEIKKVIKNNQIFIKEPKIE